MRGRRRTEDDPGLHYLPTRTIRVTCGGRVVAREMGSGRTEQGRLEWLSDDEWRQLMQAPVKA